MTKVVCFVGGSNSGKTTLIERLIPLLKARGRRVAVVKHCHDGFDIDRPGKDSARFWEAGADTVAVGSPRETFIRQRVVDEEPLQATILRLASTPDYVLAEGYRSSAFPKIVVTRDEPPDGLDGVIAVVTEHPGPVAVPRFRPSDVDALADWLEEQTPSMAPQPDAADMSLEVNGQVVPLSAFPRAAIRNAVLGLIGALDGLPDQAIDVKLEIRKARTPLGD